MTRSVSVPISHPTRRDKDSDRTATKQCLKDAERIQERNLVSGAFTRAFSNYTDGGGKPSGDPAPESMPCVGACCSEAFGERDPEAWGKG